MTDTADRADVLLATLKRTDAVRASPYDDGIWEGKWFNREPFVTIRASDYDTIRDLATQKETNR